MADKDIVDLSDLSDESDGLAIELEPGAALLFFGSTARSAVTPT